MIHTLDAQAELLNMAISVNKTKTVTIAKDHLCCKLIIKNTCIHGIQILGCRIASSRYLQEEVSQQANKAAAVARYLTQAIWNNKHGTVSYKTRIYKNCVSQIMTYGAENRAETLRSKSLLRRTKIKTLTLRDRQRSSNIRAKCNTENIRKCIRNRKTEWNQPVSIIAEDLIAKVVRNNNPQGR